VNGENRAAPSDKHKKASTLGAEHNVRKPVTGITKKIDVLSEQNEKVLFLLASRRQCSEIKQVKVIFALYDFCYTMSVSLFLPISLNRKDLAGTVACK
jgi:hypothetical protein